MREVPQGLVIVDCDGVLFDSAQANIAYYDAVLERLGEPALDGDGRDHAHRLATSQLFAWIFSDAPERVEDALRIARELDYTPFLGQLEPVPGLFPTLRWLKTRYRTAMATNRGGTIPQLVAKFGLDEWFDVIVGTRDVERPKPAPDMLFYCLERVGLEPRQAVFVGDSPSDLAAAQAAAMRFVAVGDAVEWDPRIHAFHELPGALEKLSGECEIHPVG